MSKSFAEVAMELSGKTTDESESIGKIDTADDQVEGLFQEKYQTKNSPVYRAVWDHTFPSNEFFSFDLTRPNWHKLEDSISTINRHKATGTCHNSSGKLHEDLLTDLSEAGYFGLLVPLAEKPPIKFSEFSAFLTEVARIEANVAGLASVHGCIGAVDPIKTFGNQDQKERYLPKLANGKFLSGFALTEPGAGSDMTSLKTTAVLDGDDYVVNGEKLFITNAICGRLISLVCMIDSKPQVLLVELPAAENDEFQIVNYGLHALKRLHNNGLVFKNFRVPKENLIQLERGDGLTIAYHGLNLGRISLCANASGCMKMMLESMIPWAHYRTTYGQPIKNRELVQNRIGKLAGYILSSDALVAWCSSLIDSGYRGELECIIAKTFGSECQKEAAIDLCMKTHGGRSFLEGHAIGDNIHEFLAPLIYEGEGDMLNMAFFKSLVKEHGLQYFEPIGQALAKTGKKNMSLVDMAKNYKLFLPYAQWMLKETTYHKGAMRMDGLPLTLQAYAAFAAKNLQGTGKELSSLMRKYQLKLGDRQCRISLLSRKIQHLVTIIVTCTYASIFENDIVIRTAEVSCDNLYNNIIGRHPTDQQIKRSVLLGKEISEREYYISSQGITRRREVNSDSILMRY